ncbi:NAD(P)-dependent oxidoreductase [Collinsella sp. zg1085]|uniref:NAD(P)-dependent oxidoreductase n=1 Tax=Collinsella sp. zg1085 TaxID=2844380 RepID=UPI001C0CA0C4|nr:NAD(P)-dependent oxidoreductase [Collinsella sp. zg1085]QWT17366.1 NAD(P)-dependent oxidoreductase [Collinsella sp. zg1085]
MSKSKHSVAFIGLGIMGAPIAGHILDAGFPLTVYARHPEQAANLVERGATLVESPAAAAAAADVVFTMVGFPSDVEEVYLSSEGVFAGAKPGTTLIDLTTSSPQLAEELAAAAEERKLLAFDCPVTGGDTGAQLGSLTLIVGATEETIAPVRDVLESFSAHIHCFGAPGRGQAAKLANQVALAGSLMGMADALSLAQQSGLNLEQVQAMICEGTGQSGAMKTLAPSAMVGDYRPGFKVMHMLKDIGLALQAAEDKEIALPGADTAFTLLDMLDAIGGSDLGVQAITLLYQEEAEAVAAGLDWSRYTTQAEDGCECGHEHGEEGCGCAHDAGEAHEHSCACGGHGHHHSHECSCNHEHHHHHHGHHEEA